MEEAADAVLDRVSGNRVILDMVAGAVVGKVCRTWMNSNKHTRAVLLSAVNLYPLSNDVAYITSKVEKSQASSIIDHQLPFNSVPQLQ